MNNEVKITIEGLLKYVESLAKQVEEMLQFSTSAKERELLTRLNFLLKAGYVAKVIDGLTNHKVIIPAIKKIEEMDNILDELYLRELHLSTPEEYFYKELRKKDRAQHMTLLILLWGLFGFEYVLE
ncbi:MAG: hypothetical protein J6Y06_07140 [Bacteroidales bacterium]|nr:hypothetical protein [Bacteroidales bacterium]